MLIFLLLLFHKFSGLWSTRHSSCRPPQPRRELLTEEEEEGFEGWKEEQMKRRVRVKKFCNKEKGWKETWLNDPNIHPLMFQYNAQYSLTGCLQPKVASTTWHQHFYCLESERRREKLSLLPREDHCYCYCYCCYQGRSKLTCCRRLGIRTLRLLSQPLSHSPWSGILLRGSSQPTRIR